MYNKSANISVYFTLCTAACINKSTNLIPSFNYVYFSISSQGILETIPS